MEVRLPQLQMLLPSKIETFKVTIDAQVYHALRHPDRRQAAEVSCSQSPPHGEAGVGTYCLHAALGCVDRARWLAVSALTTPPISSLLPLPFCIPSADQAVRLPYKAGP